MFGSMLGGGGGGLLGGNSLANGLIQGAGPMMIGGAPSGGSSLLGKRISPWHGVQAPARAPQQAAAGPAASPRQSVPRIYGAMGGIGPPMPNLQVNAGPIWNGQQVNRRVNAAQAQNTATTQGGINRMQEGMAAQGFGGRSPLGQQIQAQMQGMNMMNNMQAENDIRWNSAQGNADHLFQTQMGRAGLQRQLSDEDYKRQAAGQQNRSQLYRALLPYQYA